MTQTVRLQESRKLTAFEYELEKAKNRHSIAKTDCIMHAGASYMTSSVILTEQRADFMIMSHPINLKNRISQINEKSKSSLLLHKAKKKYFKIYFISSINC